MKPEPHFFVFSDIQQRNWYAVYQGPPVKIHTTQNLFTTPLTKLMLLLKRCPLMSLPITSKKKMTQELLQEPHSDSQPPVLTLWDTLQKRRKRRFLFFEPATSTILTKRTNHPQRSAFPYHCSGSPLTPAISLPSGSRSNMSLVAERHKRGLLRRAYRHLMLGKLIL